MAIQKYRSGFACQFVKIDMQSVRDSRLSNSELGLLVRLLSLPNTWKYTDVGFCRVYCADGRSALRNQMKSLEEKGYIKRVRKEKNKYGQFSGNTLIVFELSKTNH